MGAERNKRLDTKTRPSVRASADGSATTCYARRHFPGRSAAPPPRPAVSLVEEAQILDSTIARLRIAELHFPVIASIRCMENEKASRHKIQIEFRFSGILGHPLTRARQPRLAIMIQLGQADPFMGELFPIDEIELRLRAELNAAEETLRNATPEEKAEARRQFKDALHRFTTFVFAGKVPRV